MKYRLIIFAAVQLALVAAARHGTKAVLVQARPMLGGNMSSEMRMGVMGAYGGELKTVYADPLNILRFRKIAFDPVDADALRLVVTEAWGGEDEKAHVFAFDAL